MPPSAHGAKSITSRPSMHPTVQRENMFRMRGQGYSMAAIAKALKVSRATLYRWLKTGPTQASVNGYGARAPRHKIKFTMGMQLQQF